MRISANESTTSRGEILFIPWRFYLLLMVIVFFAIGLVLRVFDLAIVDQHFLRQQGNERVVRLVSAPAFRGMIVDRNGFPLGVSTKVYSVWINPQEFVPTKVALNSLSTLLGLKEKMIASIVNLNQNKKREFIYLKRGISPEIARQIKLLNIMGLYTQEEYRRYYPEGEVAAHVVGFTNIDDNGQEGLELAYNRWLQGQPGKKWVIKDRLGRVISDVETLQNQKPGNDLKLSIDRRIQYLAYKELATGVLKTGAESGSVIVLDSQMGEVLAIVNYPSFNPNNRPNHQRDRIRNRAITDIFEPGSTIKAFTVASALETGIFKQNSVIDTSPGWLWLDHHLVKDEKNNGVLTMKQILQVSSNMGTTKMVLKLPPDQLWSLLHRVGFGEITGIGFPGEQNGMLINQQPWGSFMLATLSFGYGLSVTPLQLARAYAVLANNGVKIPVSLLKQEKVPTGEPVLDPQLTKQMLSLLESVVTEGGGQKARIPGYRVAGKSGTAKMLGLGGYQKHRYISSFVGIAPVSQPRLVVAVVIRDTQGKLYYGGQVSGPIFEKIMEGTLRMLNIPPDACQ